MWPSQLSVSSSTSSFKNFLPKELFCIPNLDLNNWCWCVPALVLLVEVDEESFETPRNSTPVACWSRLQSRLMTKIFELDLEISTSHTCIRLEIPSWNALTFNSFDIPWVLKSDPTNTRTYFKLWFRVCLKNHLKCEITI